MAFQSLWDGFEAYETLNKKHLEDAYSSALVAIDTSALLDLYRFISATRSDYLAALTNLGDRLFVPHQTAVEFWRNRNSVIGDNAYKGENEISEIENAIAEAVRQFNTWVNRVGYEASQAEKVRKSLQEAHAAAISAITDSASDETKLRRHSTSEDAVLKLIVNLCEGKVNPPPDDPLATQWTKDAQARADKQIPPGYKDSKKSGDLSHGDYFFWRECVMQAQLRRLDLLIVTRDQKEDWWEKASYGSRPRVELSREFNQEVPGRRLFLALPSTLVQLYLRAGHRDGAEVTERVARVRAVESSIALQSDVEDDATTPEDRLNFKRQREVHQIAQEFVDRLPSSGLRLIPTPPPYSVMIFDHHTPRIGIRFSNLPREAVAEINRATGPFFEMQRIILCLHPVNKDLYQMGEEARCQLLRWHDGRPYQAKASSLRRMIFTALERSRQVPGQPPFLPFGDALKAAGYEE